MLANQNCGFDLEKLSLYAARRQRRLIDLLYLAGQASHHVQKGQGHQCQDQRAWCRFSPG